MSQGAMTRSKTDSTSENKQSSLPDSKSGSNPKPAKKKQKSDTMSSNSKNQGESSAKPNELESNTNDAAAAMSSTPPEGVHPALWNILSEIKTTTESTKKSVDDLRGEHLSFENRLDEAEGKVDILVSKVSDLSYKVDVLTARLSRSETEKRRLANEIEQLKAKSMGRNLIINVNDSYKEVKSENVHNVVKKFFNKELKLKDNIHLVAAHRIGSDNPKYPRPIIITLQSNDDVSKIMSHAKNLKGSKCFINKQIPQSMNERKLMCIPDFKEAKANGLRPVLRQDKLYVNNELKRQHLPQALPDELEVPENEPEVLESDAIEDGGSIFTGYACKAANMNDVRVVMDTLLCNTEVASATHVMYAYRLSEQDSIVENFESDGDWGIGFSILKFLRSKDIVNHVFFVTRKCGKNFKHIGPARFNHAAEVCQDVLDKLDV